ncbi:hypothetical protein [Leptolyngbya sp. KIOST-1]|uniref:hypothetical protein n=1 Tax=Leptolyngbya sp. KIOST-1 TaxID=1229172 RepID=UPI000691CD3E|nr:hypothetical protein [Leptolyngbya sp. KIOST-1]
MVRLNRVLLLLLLPLASCHWFVVSESLPPEPSPPEQSAPVPPHVDTLVIPGQRVGPVVATTSRAELAEIYGEAALADGSIAMGEGTTEAGTVVTPGPDQQFSVIWQDASQTRPQLIKDFGPAWQTPEGLGVGVPYSEVESALGEFQLYGFAWDYGGTVMLAGSHLERYEGYLLLRLKPADTALDRHPEAYQSMMGDQLFASDNPLLDQLEVAVGEMVVYLEPLP